MIEKLFIEDVFVNGNQIHSNAVSGDKNQQQTNEMFSEKWEKVEEQDVMQSAQKFQLQWHMPLYGFKDEKDLSYFLSSKRIIIDAGCGLGYKSAWFAQLAPSSTVIGIDFSESISIAANRYKDIKNLYFVRGDIAKTGLLPNSIDYILCDQVIHHTENPEKTFSHLASLLKKDGEFACYVYAKKALPRELLDEYFRTAVHGYSKEELWDFSKQLTELGKRLSELNIKFISPDIPLLGIKGGEYDIQRFIYWNFIKCFWKEELGREICDSTNFDWYSPSNASRYNVEEFNKWGTDNNMVKIYSHSEEACHSGRFKKL